MKCPLCKSENTRKDYDFPETMKVCNTCGCDYVVNEKNKCIDIVFNPKTNI